MRIGRGANRKLGVGECVRTVYSVTVLWVSGREGGLLVFLLVTVSRFFEYTLRDTEAGWGVPQAEGRNVRSWTLKIDHHQPPPPSPPPPSRDILEDSLHSQQDTPLPFLLLPHICICTPQRDHPTPLTIRHCPNSAQ